MTCTGLGIPVAYVEAGLRSFSREMPEEINRVLTDHCSALLFCPTETAVRNLSQESITNGVALVGDVMYDAERFSAELARRAPESWETSDFCQSGSHSSRCIGRQIRTARSLEPAARMILTDSGGVQKEAYWFGVPCVTLREEMEWVELVEAGCNSLAGACSAAILKSIRDFESGEARYPASESRGFYGDGRASEVIAKALAFQNPG